MPKRPPGSTLQDEAPGTTEELPRVGPQPPQDPLIGKTFGSYRVVKLLGEGGMGAVYLGEHPAIGSRVAIKVLHPRYADDQQTVDRFFNEARAVNLIGHDNIVQILDFNLANGRHYFVMEYLSGRTLQHELRGDAGMALGRAGPIVSQCCKALQAAHERGIFHRDFKPDNVFLIRRGDRADFVKLVDFGIAKLTDPGSGVKTQAGLVLGTPAYMSPEQAAGETDIDGRSDVYSLGVVFFQMVTGRTPFASAGPSLRQVMLAHLRDPPPKPRSLRPDLPAECEAIILRALEKNPDDRFPTMAELEAAVAGCLAQQGLSLELPLAGAIEDDSRPRRPGPPSAPRVTPRASRAGTTPPPKTPSLPPATTGRHRTSAARRALLVTGVLGAIAGAAGFVMVLRSGDRTPGKPRPGVAQRPVETPPEEPPKAPPVESPPPEAAPVVTATPATPPPAPEEHPAPSAPEKRGGAGGKKRPAGTAVAAVEMVQLKLATAPESQFIAIWPKGSQAGKTPMAIEVPKGTEVRIRYLADGYQVEEAKVTASSDQVVFRALSPSR